MGERKRAAKGSAHRAGAEQTTPPGRRFARYLAAYRGNLTRGEAARRSGLPESLWEMVEAAQPSEQASDPVPAAIVAAMCVSVGADVETGLSLAGHPPEKYRHLVERPPVYMPLTRSSHSLTGPYIATPHVVTEVLDVASEDAHRRMAGVYRHLAESNWQVANRLTEQQPDERTDYWVGYAAAVRAVAEQQAWAADHEEAQAAAQLGPRWRSRRNEAHDRKPH